MRSRNWIKTESDGYLNSQAILTLSIFYCNEEDHWEVIAQDGEGELYTVRVCPDHAHAERELQNTIDWLDGRE